MARSHSGRLRYSCKVDLNRHVGSNPTESSNKLKYNNYDIIISNPPYIPYDGYVQDKVKNNEPNLALFASDNGLYFYKEILNKHLNNLNYPGLLAFETGDNQKELLEEIVKSMNLKYSFEKDLQGLPRYLFIFK